MNIQVIIYAVSNKLKNLNNLKKSSLFLNFIFN